MAMRPTRRVRWAWNAADGAIVEPPSGASEVGWSTEQRPSAQYFNFLQNSTGVWIDFLSGPDLSSWIQRDWIAAGSPPALDGHTTRIIVAVDTVSADTADTVHWAMAGYVAADTKPTLMISHRGNGWIPCANAPTAAIPYDFKQLGAFWWLVTSGGNHLYRTPLVTGALDDSMVSWSGQTLGAGPTTAKAIAYDSTTGHYALIAQDVGWYSLNGTTWLAWNDDPTRTGLGQDIVYDGAGWVAICDDAQVLTATSVTDLWLVAATLDGGTAGNWRLTVGPDSTVVAWLRDAATSTSAWQSDDHGATWTEIENGVPSGTHRLAYADGVWIAAGEDYPYLSQSNDLTAWTTLPLPVASDLSVDPELYEVATDGATWVAVGDEYTWRSGTARDVAGGSMVPGSTPPVLADAGYLRGHIVASDAPSAGNVLVWSAITGWTPQAQPGGLPTASGASEFAVSTGAGTTYTARTVAQTRTVLGLGGAALLAVGTTAGTVAAGDDSRITGAVASSTLTTRGDLFVRGASTIGRLALGAAKRILSSDGTDAVYQTFATLMADLGTTRGSIVRRGASAWEAVTGAEAADTFLGGDGTDLAVRTAAQVRTSLRVAPPYVMPTGLGANDVLVIVPDSATEGGTTFTDLALGRTLTPTAAYHSTLRRAFTRSCMKLGAAAIGGSNGYVTAAQSNDFNFATGDFTIQVCATVLTPVGVTQRLISQGRLEDGDKRWAFGLSVAGKLNFAYSASGIVDRDSVSSLQALCLGRPVLYEVGRSGTTLKQFVDGVVVYTGTDSAALGVPVSGSPASADALIVGARNPSSPTEPAPGLEIHYVRVVKGACLHTAAYDPTT